MRAEALGRMTMRQTQLLGTAAGAATGVAMVPLLMRWGQHRWLIGTGHAIAAVFVLGWTVAGLLIGLAARRLAGDRREAAAMAVAGVGAGTLTIWQLMAAFPLQNYRGGDTSRPVAVGAEAITAAATAASLLILTTSAALARSARRTSRRSKMLKGITMVFAVALAASVPAAVQSARNETRVRDSYQSAGGAVVHANHMVEGILRPFLSYLELQPVGSSLGTNPFIGDTDPAQHLITAEPHGSAPVVDLVPPRAGSPTPDMPWIESPFAPGDVYSMPSGPYGSLVVVSTVSPDGSGFMALCTGGAESDLAQTLGYSPAPWNAGFCDGTVHIFTTRTTGAGGRQAQISVLGHFSAQLYCPDPDTASPSAKASWVKAAGSSPCLDMLSDSWHHVMSERPKLTAAIRWANGTRITAVVLTVLLAIAAAPFLTAMRGRLRMPGDGPGPRRVGRPTSPDISHGWAASLIAAAADALDDPGSAERFLEEWQADLAQFDKPWRRLLYALSVRLLAPRRLRAARHQHSPDPRARR